MGHVFELKDINFSAFTDKLKIFSENFGLRNIVQTADSLSFRWDASFFGLGFNVELRKIDHKSFLWSYDYSSLVGLLLFFALILLLIFKTNLVLYLGITGVVVIIIVLVERHTIEKNLQQLFEQLEQKPLPKGEQKQKPTEGLVCPACGEPLTEYDEYCPSCGLYLGKVWKKQPAHRTDLFGTRLVYQYKPSPKKSEDKRSKAK
jgi:hypothetical protein